MQRRVIKALGLLGAGLLAGCASGAAGPASAPGLITISTHTCGSGWLNPHPGLQTLQIRNVSSQAVEVSLINAATSAVYARVEGVGPGTTRSMPVSLGSGRVAFQCDGNNYAEQIGPSFVVPGHVADGVSVAPVSPTELFPVTAAARSYVSRGLTTVLQQVTALSAAIQSGNLAQARTLWLPAHLSWTRLGSAYGMFANYDDTINGIPNGLPGGVRDPGWTGFYRLEYGLWHHQPAAELAPLASGLVHDVHGLSTGWPGMEMTPSLTVSDLALRTHEVLENAMRFQLSGQDDFGSGTTIATMSAAIDATRSQLQILNPLLAGRLGDLPTLTTSLNRLAGLVDQAHARGRWTPSAQLSTEQKTELDAAAGQTLELLAQIPPMFEEKAIP
jgi:iron uptake system EfeUOB component EfeO/EfeM